MMPKRIPFRSFSVILCLMLFLGSCTDNPSNVDEKPPTVPPSSSMDMDFSSYQDNQKTAETQATDNFSHAAGAAVIMKAVVDINLAIPKALLIAAANADAELNADEKWEWSYSKSTDGNDYAVRLVAERDGEDTVNWNFYVTNSQLGLQDQLFFSGTTNTDGTEGVWTYYNLQNNETQEEVSKTTWTVNGEDDVSLKLEVTSDRNDHMGDYIEYTFDGTVKSATYYDASADETTELQINVDTHVGFFTSPNYNGGMQSCWDENFQDIACSEI